MKRKILLILLLCGLTTVSVVLEYRASAERYACEPLRVCVPDVKIPNCEVAPPFPRSCGFPMKRPQKLSFEAVAIVKSPVKVSVLISALDRAGFGAEVVK